MNARSAAAATLLLMLSIGGLTTAAAAAPMADADTEIRYEGTISFVLDDGYSGSYDASLVVDCAAQPCAVSIELLLVGGRPDLLTAGQILPLSDGSLSESLPEYGDVCGDYWLGAGVLDVTVTARQATVHRTVAGDHVVVQCSDREAMELSSTWDGALDYVSGRVCLLDASCADVTPTSAATADADSDAGASGATAPRDPDDPSVLSTLPTSDDGLTLSNGIWAAAGALILALLVALPAALLDSASDRLTERRAARRAARGLPPDATNRSPFTLIGWPFALAGLVAAAIISVFVDPHIGFDAVGARTLVSILIAYLAATAIGWAIVAIVIRRMNPTAPTRVEFRPVTLLIVAGSVLFSRLTGFEPGIVFGLVAGIGFGAMLAAVEKATRARATLISISWAFVAGLISWLAYSLLAPALGDHPSWGDLLGRETLAAIAITGLATLPVALLPFTGLPGRALWVWHRWVWAVAYALAAAAFLFVLMPLPESWDQVGLPLWTWAGAYAAFAISAVVVWLVVVRPWTRRPPASPGGK